ncbi:MAG: hypothetical protein KF774_13030 [Planctomyces sp.]|nr:hypothetical protein [Planctomyces sp.]
MRRMRVGMWAALSASVLNLISPMLCTAGNPFAGTTTVERLAKQIDKLERHIDEYGTVVAKTPDVWGEARLTKYRLEYEQQMSKQLDAFGDTINASIARSDNAFLANAFALQAAIGSGRRKGSTPAPTQSNVQVTTTSTPAETTAPADEPVRTREPIAIPGGPSAAELMGAVSPSGASTDPGGLLKTKRLEKEIALEPVISLDQRSRYLNHLHHLRRINDGDDVADFPGYSLNLVRIPVSVMPGSRTREGFGAEVTITAKPHLHDELLPKVFRHLVVNDVVDVLTFPLTKLVDRKDAMKFAKTLQKHGCKEPSDEELKKADEDARKQQTELRAILAQICHIEARIAALNARSTELQFERLSTKSQLNTAETHLKELESLKARLRLEIANLSAREAKYVSDLKNPVIRNAARAAVTESMESGETDRLWLANRMQANISAQGVQVQAAEEPIDNLLLGIAADLEQRRAQLQDYDNQIESLSNQMSGIQLSESLDKSKLANLNSQQAAIMSQLEAAKLELANAAKQVEDEKLYDQLASANAAADELRSQIAANEALREKVTFDAPVSPGRRAQMPFPPSQLVDIVDCQMLGGLAVLAAGLKSEPLHTPHVLLLDVQKTLLQEADHAYEFLVRTPIFWDQCSDSIVHAVRTSDKVLLSNLRCQFQATVTQVSQSVEPNGHVAALAWLILVESALLNERLVEDIRHLAAAKNAIHLHADGLQFSHPNPCPEARAVFNQYVACRWPIHVVALDPVTDDQNVADAFSMRREMQLAMSLAFASGRMSAQNFTQYARRLELDQETIALNRTAVGFSHGDDTFGWRFSPRVQNPDSDSNCKVAVRDLLWGGQSRDSLIKQRRLEPGIRECTAIVIMPSFVPYVIFDVRSNWFRLTNPKKHELDLRKSMELSQEITCLKSLSMECAQDAHLYRPDEVYRLTRAVHQLEQRLPLQTAHVPMPYENSLGGFEFFNSGVPDLAPELHGFYGEPGIQVNPPAVWTAAANQKPKAEPYNPITSLFLVGDNFSVHEAHVIAGNRRLTPQILSRQIMRIEVPSDVRVVDGRVDIHIATPYGVSNHLLVPATEIGKAEAEIEKVVAKHVADKHVDKVLWDKTEAIGRILLSNCREVEAFCYPSPLWLVDATDSPFKGEQADLRCVVSVKRKDKDPEKRGGSQTDIPVEFTSFGSARRASVDLGKFQSQIADLLKRGEVHPDTEEVHIVGYLRFKEKDGAFPLTTHSDAQPVIRVEGVLKVKVDVIDPLGGTKPANINVQCPCPPAPSTGTSGGTPPAAGGDTTARTPNAGAPAAALPATAAEPAPATQPADSDMSFLRTPPATLPRAVSTVPGLPAPPRSFAPPRQAALPPASFDR